MATYFDDEVQIVPRPLKPDQVVLWRKDLPDLTTRRQGMFPHQLDWWELPEFVKMLVAGYGAGKSLILCMKIIALALQHAPAPGAIVSPTYGMSRKTVWEQTIALCEKLRSARGGRFRFQINKAHHEIRISYRGRIGLIYFLSGEEPDRLKGPNLAFAGIDEPFIQDVRVYNQIMARIRVGDPRYQQVLLTGTPEQLGWGYDLAQQDNVGVVHAKTTDNLTLPDAYSKRILGTMADKEALAYHDGQFVEIADGTVFHAFSRQEHVYSFELPKNPRLIVGMDFNVNPMAAIVCYVEGEHLHVLHEIELSNSDTDDMCHYLKEHFPNQIDWIYPDPTGDSRSTVASGGITNFVIIRRHGYQIDMADSPYPYRDTVNAVNGKLRARDGSETMSIHPRCKKLIQYMQQYRYDRMNKQKNMSHLLSALRYVVARRWPVFNREEITLEPFGFAVG